MHDKVQAAGWIAILDECIYPKSCDGLCNAALGDQRRTLEMIQGHVRLLTAVPTW